MLWTERTGIRGQVKRRDREENKDKGEVLPVVISALAGCCDVAKVKGEKSVTFHFPALSSWGWSHWQSRMEVL
ncbi:uncharacterized [Tachysurus ichikawai]